MAKISLKNYDELIVTDKEAERIANDKELAVDDFQKSLPYTIAHEDGLWAGTLKDISSINSSEKRKKTHYLKQEDVERFHTTHGYGKYKNEYVQGYGLLDVPTQYMIGTKQARLHTENGRTSLVRLKPNEATIKWAELWEDYLTKLDPFNELRQPDDKFNN